MKSKLTINYLARRINQAQYKLYRDLGKAAFKEGYHMLIIFNNDTAIHCPFYRSYKQALKSAVKRGTLMLAREIPTDFNLLTDYEQVRAIIDDYNRVCEDYEDPIDRLREVLDV